MEDTVFSKLIVAMNNMGTPSKDATNPYFKQKYTTLPELLKVIKPALKEQELALSQKIEIIEGSTKLITGVYHDKGFLTLDVRPINQVSKIQEQGSVETYTRRYALQTAFGLSGEDDDGNSGNNGQVVIPDKIAKDLEDKIIAYCAVTGKQNVSSVIKKTFDGLKGKTAQDYINKMNEISEIIKQVNNG